MYTELIKKYNLKSFKINKKQAVSCCPFHLDNNPSFAINLETGKWICFAKCGYGDIVDFVMRVENISRDEAIKKTKTFEGSMEAQSSWFDLLKSYVATVEQKLLHKPIVTDEFFVIDEGVLDKFKFDNYEYMYSRGFSREILEEFEIGFYDRCVTIPIRNEDKQLIAVVARPTYPTKKKYMPLIPLVGFEKNKILFGLDKVGIKETTVILVEGQLDVIKAFQNGFRNVVALQGSQLSDYQEGLLLKRFNNIVLALDNDEAGAKALSRISKRMIGKVGLYKFCYNGFKQKDLGDLDREQILKGLENSIWIT